MADENAPTEENSIAFSVKASNDSRFTLTLPESTTVLDLKNKLSSSEYADTPADRQRLIYSGRVLKDNDTLATYKIKDGHTIHLVKSAASNQRQTPSTPSTSAQGSASGTTPSLPGVPTNFAAGTGNNPLAGLTGARYAGYAQLPGAGMFGPDGGMGPPPDTETMLNMLENPQFQATMNEALQNPALIDMMIQQNPMLRDMGPGVRQMMQSPEFRRMLTDPNSLRQMAQLQRALGGLGGGFLGGEGGSSAFPAPGVTNTTHEENRNQQQGQGNDRTTATGSPPRFFNAFLPPGGGGGAANPFAQLLGANPTVSSTTGAPPGTSSSATAPSGEQTNATRENTASGAASQTTPPHPLSFLFNPSILSTQQAQPGSQPSVNTTSPQAPQDDQGAFNAFSPQYNQLFRDPALLQNFAQALGSGGVDAGNPLASLFNPQAAAAPSDNRPPEERYAEQLRQLNDMGFVEFDRNIEALRRSGGSVQGALEYLLSQQ